MANLESLESSWQDSVIKLAQIGNLRAIAFWLNRYLVPQGICAQVTHDEPGRLFVRVVCHRQPDRDRLVRFIGHRLCKLNAENIQEAHITAQLVGSQDSLWEKTVKITPIQADFHQESANVPWVVEQLLSGQLTSEPQTVPAIFGTHDSHETPAPVAQPLFSAPGKSQRPHFPGQVESRPLPLRLVAQSLWRRLQRSTQMTIRQVTQPQQVTHSQQVTQPQQATQPQTTYPKTFAPRPKTSYALSPLQLQLQRTGYAAKRNLRRSLRWILAFPPHMQIMLLAGSVCSLILLGVAYRALQQYAADSSASSFSQSGGSTFGSRKFSLGASNTVWTALENVPVLQQPVTQSSDPAVTLLFANSAALGRVSAGQSAHRLADMVITSLDQLPPVAATAAPVGLGAPAEGSASDSSASDSSAADSSETETLPSQPAPTLTIPDLSANGVDLVNLAHDEAIAAGGDPLAQAKDLMRKNGVNTLGAGQNRNEARRPVVVDVKGQRIAYLGYTDATQRAADGLPGVNGVTEAEITKDIKAIRDQVDWVVVTFQWGQDSKAYPEDTQVKLAHAAVDQGADLVVGTSNGMTQGGEVYKGRAIAYALGSGVTHGVTNGATAALKVTLLDKKMKLEFVPVQQGQVSTDGSILQQLKQSSSLFDQPLESSTILDGQPHLHSAPSDGAIASPTAPFVSDPDPSLPQP